MIRKMNEWMIRKIMKKLKLKLLNDEWKNKMNVEIKKKQHK